MELRHGKNTDGILAGHHLRAISEKHPLTERLAEMESHHAQLELAKYPPRIVTQLRSLVSMLLARSRRTQSHPSTDLVSDQRVITAIVLHSLKSASKTTKSPRHLPKIATQKVMEQFPIQLARSVTERIHIAKRKIAERTRQRNAPKRKPRKNKL